MRDAIVRVVKAETTKHFLTINQKEQEAEWHRLKEFFAVGVVRNKTVQHLFFSIVIDNPKPPNFAYHETELVDIVTYTFEKSDDFETRWKWNAPFDKRTQQ